MKKRFFIPLLLMCCICLCSCTDKTEKSDAITEEIQIPFLMYENNSEDNTLEAKLLYWNVYEGIISDRNEVIYRMSADENAKEHIEPLIWGDGNFIVNDVDSIQKVKQNVSIIKADDVSLSVWGENIKAVACFDDEHNFIGHEISIEENGTINTMMSENFTINNDAGEKVGIFPSYIKYDETSGKVTFVSVDFSSIDLNKLYVFEANVDNISEVKARIISLEKNINTNGNAMPTMYNAVMNNNRFYFQSFNSLAYCDINSETSNTLDELSYMCRNIVKEGKFNPDFEKAIIPIGSYEDVIIVNVPISTDIGLENIVCAISDNKIIGSIHLKKNGIWEIRTENTENISKFDVSNRDLYVKFYEYLTFPKY